MHDQTQYLHSITSLYNGIGFAIKQKIKPQKFNFEMITPNLFVFSHIEHFFSHLAAITITSDRAVNLDSCFALTAFSSEVLLLATLTATRDLRS
jgi:hypothetical protein